MKVEVGADLSVLRSLGGHTTTQPSSIEEEGEGPCNISSADLTLNVDGS